MRKFIFFIKSLKNKKKEADTNFLLLCQLRNIVGQFKKAHLQRPIKILFFLKAANSKIFNIKMFKIF